MSTCHLRTGTWGQQRDVNLYPSIDIYIYAVKCRGDFVGTAVLAYVVVGVDDATVV